MTRKIEIKTWKSSVPRFDENKKVIGMKDVDENLLIAINHLLGSKRPEELPRGLEKFRIFGKIAKAFDAAAESNILELEAREYDFLKEIIEKDVPAAWGMNNNLCEAITAFVEAKDE